MQNTRLTITVLLISGIVILLLIGGFLLTLSRSRGTNDGGVDSQGKIDRTVIGGDNKKGPTKAVENDESGPADYINDALEGQRRNNPDIFLYNKIPFENQYFRIEGVARPEGSPDFSFIVTIKGQDTPLSRAKLNDWLTELGLSPGQIAGLLIEYR